MVESKKVVKNRKKPNDTARFVGTIATTTDGELAQMHSYLDNEKIEVESQYDGLYAICTDLLDDNVSEILKVSEGRWQIKQCFRIMKTYLSSR